MGCSPSEPLYWERTDWINGAATDKVEAMSLCNVCNVEQPRIFIRQIDKVTGDSHSLEICLNCAINQGLLPSHGPVELKHLLQSDVTEILAKSEQVSAESVDESFENLFLFEPSGSGKEEADPAAVVRCPGCQTSFEDVRNTARFGCHQCYTTFEKEAGQLLSKLHGTDEHVGSRPHNLEMLRRRREELDQLKQLLDAQVLIENYEEAAKLRDRIATLEKAPLDTEIPSEQEANEAGGADT